MSTSKGGGGRIINPEEMFQANAEYNRLNQYTPYGSVEYSGPNNTNVTQTMSPEMLALMNQQMGMRGGALSQLLGMYGAQPTNIGNPGDPAAAGGGAAGGGTGDPSSGAAYGDVIGGLPGIGEGLPDMSYDLGLESLPPQYNSLNLEGLPGYEGLDLGSLQEIPGEGDLNALRGNVEKSLYERSTSLLDPMYNEQEQRLAEVYANRGMPVGAEERTDEFNRFDDSRSRAYQQAANEAVIGGGQEMSRMLSDAMGVRGQGLNEQMSLFGTGLQGRQQGLSELLAQVGVGNQGRATTLSERLAQLGAEQGTRGQLFNEQMGTRGQLYNELMGTRGAEFSQLASILGLSQPQGSAGDLGSFYGPGQVDVSGIAGTYQGGQNAAHATDSGFYSNLISNIFSFFG
jgi:hypothetical protein